jgi:hypothetical protein
VLTPAIRRTSAMCRLGSFVLPLLSAGLLAACEGSGTTDPRPSFTSNGPNGKNAPVHVTPHTDTMDALYDTLVLASSVDVSWSSLTPGVATVDESGHVVSIGTGLGLIRALGEGGRKADTAEILVRQLVASVEVTPDSITVPQESLDTLTAVVADANGYPIVDALVEWISDLISVATVAGGVVTPGDTGMTTIRANVDGVSDTASVWVVPPIANPYP